MLIAECLDFLDPCDSLAPEAIPQGPGWNLQTTHMIGIDFPGVPTEGLVRSREVGADFDVFTGEGYVIPTLS
jgi:hypothetical protein